MKQNRESQYLKSAYTKVDNGIKVSLKSTPVNCCSSYQLVLQARNWLRDLVVKNLPSCLASSQLGLKKVIGKEGEKEGLG